MYPCGKCIVCKEKKRRQWALRMEAEKHYNKSCYFVTLTYADDNLYYLHDDCPPSVSKAHFQNFMKKLRRSFSFKIRFFGVSEYGSESSRPHMHFMLFLPEFVSLSEMRKIVSDCWQLGFNSVKNGSVTRMYYIAKYTVKGSSHPNGTEKPLQSSSISPPIGFRYFKDNLSLFDSDLSSNCFTGPSFRKSSIPRSFENHYKKIIDDKSRLSLIPPSLKRKNLLARNSAKFLRDYLNEFNKLSPSEFMEMRDNIERRYKRKHTKSTNL